jgi:hypothetical protein
MLFALPVGDQPRSFAPDFAPCRAGVNAACWIAGDYVLSVMAARVAAIHVFVDAAKRRMAGMSPAMTIKAVPSGN